ncbi:hypothetical protein P168DRAFT_319359 [Aspergillus campestris IBT 28561]|uniref:Oxidoreductase N-terminal domain-containing protein n=1 Tax=Aspergillus campestris (strain IBT 28561) TaxID=1392248 RepID=A0A2I1D1Z0_ASPC2|nr:uncharacterized protein P168DRAFT_319359 [Aspergillus campestris IBT 28561]PKY03902.1 hypothetical protein P168DRAFT_319359 [Aspergillus campestris IBT 28561]
MPQTKCWTLRQKPTGWPTLSGPKSTFALTTRPIPPLGKNELLVKTVYLSNDPAQRTWIDSCASPGRLYVTPIETNQVMASRGIGEISTQLPLTESPFTSTAWEETFSTPFSPSWPYTALKNWFQVITMRLRIQGFIVLDYAAQAHEARAVLRRAIEEGKLVLDAESETVCSVRFEDIPAVWMKLFEGGNRGKLVTQLE